MELTAAEWSELCYDRRVLEQPSKVKIFIDRLLTICLPDSGIRCGRRPHLVYVPGMYSWPPRGRQICRPFVSEDCLKMEVSSQQYYFHFPLEVALCILFCWTLQLHCKFSLRRVTHVIWFVYLSSVVSSVMRVHCDKTAEAKITWFRW